MDVALVGCGYVADFYMRTFPNHPDLRVAGVWDTNAARLSRFAAHHSLRAYTSYEELLADSAVRIVVNLTNPRSHAEVSRQALQAGKHVYSEKPLATGWDDACDLVRLAEEHELQIASAPCSLLSETAQTLGRAIRAGLIGKVRAAHAELHDGMIHRSDYRDWKSDSEAPWPAKDEFEVGCTFEHAGYYLTWLCGFFGPAKTITSFARCVIEDKRTDEPLDPPDTPDYSVGSIEFADRVIARISCSIVAPHDHSLTIVGDEGVLTIRECWDYGAPIAWQRRTKHSHRAEKYPRLAKLLGLGPRNLRLVRPARFQFGGRGSNRMDFARGVADLAEAIQSGRESRLSARFSLHINELTLALQYPERMGSPRLLATTFDPVPAMPWAV
jgi:predicted dehydrogenase